ncbi:E3 ubiquitin-protein ligase ubr3-like isoform x2 [Plakobranchus ocellatus]|uniref:E3 ubiquitin-protein ligase ubr3-like isoform x2 n=1 Tax=Plakobranchus ocellatus TaxID=259542 RepID=A0AAV4DDV3_9GAST|nr:E3 ubiquitin-protein ligase ubr3-like isoform x2 [Plakobranchus ocellatus]
MVITLSHEAIKSSTVLKMDSQRDTITFQKASLQRLAYTGALCSFFLYFTKLMLFGPNALLLPGVTVDESLKINFVDGNGNAYLTGYSDFSKPEWRSPEFCRFQQNTVGKGCLEDPHNQRIKIQEDESGVEGVTCHQVKREGLRCVNQMVMDCYHLGDSHWYGGYESVNQLWPLRKAVPAAEGVILTSEEEEPVADGMDLPMGPYVSGDFGMHKSEPGNVLERLFFSSSGVGIMIDKDSPLYLSFNQHYDGKICIAGLYDGAHYFSQLGKPPVLEYTVCKARNVREIHSYMKRRFIEKPEGIPNIDLFKKPKWSTWSQFQKDVTQEKVMDFADKILTNGLPASQIEIDDDWTEHYGDLDFNPVKFPDPKKMVADLNEKGLNVSLWTHPFLSLRSKSFKEAVESRFTVMSRGSTIPALTTWWDGDMAGLLDVTNPAAVLWYNKKLQRLQDLYKITSFKFDAGEAHFVPHSHLTLRHMASSNEYSALWAELGYNADPDSRRQEVRVGWGTQRLPIFVRLMDRSISFDRHGGLASVIPSVLTMSVLGYPFVLPDMIGGSPTLVATDGGPLGSAAKAEINKENDMKAALHKRGVYLRWLQACIFLPALQFSIGPWIYDQHVVELTRQLLAVREQYMPRILELAQESVTTGDPIIRPLWWVAPEDPEALVVSDEFLVGNDILVAPIVVDGARKRDIYLPEGRWQDKLRGGEVTGPINLKDYQVALEELSFFERIQEQTGNS